MSWYKFFGRRISYVMNLYNFSCMKIGYVTNGLHCYQQNRLFSRMGDVGLTVIPSSRVFKVLFEMDSSLVEFLRLL